jgi:S-disulfanyl-L-cysteine oxidoreductase SoxD
VLAKKNVLFCLGLIIGGISPQLLHGQASPAASDGVYSADQAQRGETLYKKQCTACHGDALDGVGPYPPLSGNDFLTKYEGKPASNLYDMIQKLMPATAPGSLSRSDAADLFAYILSFNKFPAGKTDLPSDADSLKKLIVPTPTPPPSVPKPAQ